MSQSTEDGVVCSRDVPNLDTAARDHPFDRMATDVDIPMCHRSLSIRDPGKSNVAHEAKCTRCERSSMASSTHRNSRTGSRVHCGNEVPVSPGWIASTHSWAPGQFSVLVPWPGAARLSMHSPEPEPGRGIATPPGASALQAGGPPARVRAAGLSQAMLVGGWAPADAGPPSPGKGPLVENDSQVVDHPAMLAPSLDRHHL